MYKIVCTLLFALTALPAFSQRETDTFHLYFDLGVPTLSSISEKKIDLLIYNDKIINGANIMIVGYADYLGTEDHNQHLSMRRAASVKEYLVKYGIDAADIKLCEGKGEVKYNGATGREGSPGDRRVDIVVNNRTRKIAPQKTPYGRLTNQKANLATIDEMKKLRPGTTFLLKNVYFPADRHIIKPESRETLEKLFIILKDNPKIKISIEGHVCCIPPEAPDAEDEDTHEISLSVNRAKAIYNYLVAKGIDPLRLKYEGFGKRRPIVANELTEEDAEKNRRVEIRIIEN